MICCAPSGSSLMIIPEWARGTQPCACIYMKKQAHQTFSAFARLVTLYHLGRVGEYMGWFPPGGAIILGQVVGGEGTGVYSDFGAELWITEGLVVGGLLMTLEQDSMALRIISILFMSTLTTLGLLTYRQSARAPKREHLELAITKRLTKVLNVIPWISPKWQ